jgi:hypothetical protein
MLPAIEKEANLLCYAIEEMPASEQQTRLSIQAAALAANLRLLLGAVTAATSGGGALGVSGGAPDTAREARALPE